MSVLFLLFCAQDLKKLTIGELYELRFITERVLGSPESSHAMSLALSPKTQLSPDTPAYIQEAVKKRFFEVSLQLRSPQSDSPNLSKFDFDQLVALRSEPNPEEQKKENMILEWAIGCEVNNFEFYAPLLRAKQAAYEFFSRATGERPKGPDSLYSPFNPFSPLYKLYNTLSKSPGSEWLERHWNPDELPNNEWVAATDRGMLAHDPSLDKVIGEVQNLNYDAEDVCFTFVSFDLWQ